MADFVNHSADPEIQLALYQSRKRLKVEMSRALSCISPAAKRRLAAEWKEKYSDLFYRELLSCARNKQVARDISNWDLDEFDDKRLK